ncbi:transcription coregulator activity protein [Homalodisca vitripennis]|nr:transcription coregulator activity protein [Homalodisca vitripennis]
MNQQQQLKLQKAVQAQKEQQALADSSGTINGLITSVAVQNGPLANGDVASPSTHTPVAVQTQQPSKPLIMTNPAISALANDLKNSAQQYQQQQQAAANAAAAAAAAASAVNVASGANPTVNFVASQQSNNHHNNAAILSLLNNNSGSSAAAANPTLNQLLNNVISPSSKQQVLTTRKMTLTNLINPRSIAINPQSSSTNQVQAQSVRVSLSSLTNQLSSPPLTQQKARIVPATVQYSGRRLSDSTPAATSSSLGLSMPGLSALLAGTPSADNPVPGASSSNSALLERLSTPPSYPSSSPKPPPAPSPTAINLNLASVQGALASIPGLQNVQVSIPGLAVPISMSLNNSSPHIVTSLPVTASLPIVIVSVSGNSPTATLVFTNSTPGSQMMIF